MTEEKTYTLEELDAMDSEAVDAETANTYSLEDLERLDSWSEGSSLLEKTAISFGKGFASDTLRIPDEIGQLIKETGEKGGAGMAIPSFNDGVNIARALTGTEIERGKTDDLLINAGQMLSDKNKEFVNRLNLKPEEGSRLSKVMFDLGAGTSNVMTSLGLLYATRSPSLLFGLFGARQKAQIYEESRDAGKDPLQASALSSAAGLVEGGIEALGGVAFLKSISFNKFVTRALLGAIEQGAEEGSQQTGEELITKLSGVRKDSFNDSLLRVAYSAALGVVLGVPAGIVSGSLQKTSVKEEIKSYGFSDEQAIKIMDKVTEKTIEDGTVNQEITKFLEEEIKVTEKSVNENIQSQSLGAMAADESDIYSQNFKIQQTGKQEAGISQVYSQVSKTASKILEPISTRLKNVNPKLKYKLRRFESDLKQQILKDEKSIRPFLESYEKLSPKDQSDLDLALKNKDKEKIKDIIGRNQMKDQYKAVRETLDALYERGQESGLDIGFLEDYFPRKVKDYEGMLKYWQKQDGWPEVQKRINEKSESLGRDLTNEEKVAIVNSQLLGARGKGMSKPGNIKKREIRQVSAELNQFYQSSPQALTQYIYRLNDFLEARRFFGKSAKGTDLSEQTINDSVGAFVLEQLEKGTMKGHQVKEVEDVLKARFLQRGTGQLTSAIKNISYIETMGSPISAITQIGDIGVSLYKNGFYQTGKSLSKAVAGQSVITKEDLAIERVLEEYSDRTNLNKTLDKIFKLTGLNWMDNLGKETFVNAAFDRLSSLAQNPTPAFKEQMETIFEDEAEQVTEDLKSKKATDNVKFLLFSELADVQPIALSEMPEYYLNSGNGRFLYMLKTYTIKQIDLFRNEVFLQMKDNPTKALGNLTRLTSLVILANATADIIKDLVLNRPLEWPDYLTNNILRLFGVSKYSYYKFKTEGVAQGVASVVLPPVAHFITNAIKDVEKIMKGEFVPIEAETLQGVPIVGKLGYWWFGGGRAKVEKKTGKSKKKFKE